MWPQLWTKTTDTSDLEAADGRKQSEQSFSWSSLLKWAPWVSGLSGVSAAGFGALSVALMYFAAQGSKDSVSSSAGINDGALVPVGSLDQSLTSIFGHRGSLDFSSGLGIGDKKVGTRVGDAFVALASESLPTDPQPQPKSERYSERAPKNPPGRFTKDATSPSSNTVLNQEEIAEAMRQLYLTDDNTFIPMMAEEKIVSGLNATDLDHLGPISFVATDNGTFIESYEQLNTGLASKDVYIGEVDLSGNVLQSKRMNTETDNDQINSHVLKFKDGYLGAWKSGGQSDAFTSQIFDKALNKIGTNIKFGVYGSDFFITNVSEDNNEFDFLEYGYGSGSCWINHMRFAVDFSGARIITLSPEKNINKLGSLNCAWMTNCFSESVADNGEALVVYTLKNTDYSVIGSILNSDASIKDSEFEIGLHKSKYLSSLSIARLDRDVVPYDFAVFFDGLDTQNFNQIYRRMVTLDNGAVGEVAQINLGLYGGYSQPVTGQIPQGGYILAAHKDDNNEVVFRLDKDATTVIGNEQPLNTGSSILQRFYLNMAIAPDGTFISGWNTQKTSSSNTYNVNARTFATSALEPTVTTSIVYNGAGLHESTTTFSSSDIQVQNPTGDPEDVLLKLYDIENTWITYTGSSTPVTEFFYGNVSQQRIVEGHTKSNYRPGFNIVGCYGGKCSDPVAADITYNNQDTPPDCDAMADVKFKRNEKFKVPVKCIDKDGDHLIYSAKRTSGKEMYAGMTVTEESNGDVNFEGTVPPNYETDVFEVCAIETTRVERNATTCRTFTGVLDTGDATGDGDDGDDKAALYEKIGAGVGTAIFSSILSASVAGCCCLLSTTSGILLCVGKVVLGRWDSNKQNWEKYPFENRVRIKVGKPKQFKKPTSTNSGFFKDYIRKVPGLEDLPEDTAEMLEIANLTARSIRAVQKEKSGLLTTPAITAKFIRDNMPDIQKKYDELSKRSKERELKDVTVADRRGSDSAGSLPSDEQGLGAPLLKKSSTDESIEKTETKESLGKQSSEESIIIGSLPSSSSDDSTGDITALLDAAAPMGQDHHDESDEKVSDQKEVAADPSEIRDSELVVINVSKGDVVEEVDTNRVRPGYRGRS